MKRYAFLFLAALAGCTTTDALEHSRFKSFNGLTMSQFMADALVTPVTHYDTGGKRVFVAEKGTCAMHLETVANGRGSGPDGWTITSIRRKGACTQV